MQVCIESRGVVIMDSVRRISFNILWILVYFWSGFYVTVLQSFLCLAFRVSLFNPAAYYKITGLMYSTFWTQLSWYISLNMKIRCFFKDPKSRQLLSHTRTILLINHQSDLDTFVTGSLAKDITRNTYAIAKDSWKYVPIIGWSYYFKPFVFIKRNFQKDQQNLSEGIKRILAIEDPLMMLLLFPEGTRMAQSKYEESVKFAEKNGIEPFKYHLIPRTKGFAEVIKHVKQSGKECHVFNVHIKYSGQPTPTIFSIIRGQKSGVDIYSDCVTIDNINSTSDENISKFLIDLFRRKDDLMEYHKTNGRFPGTEVSSEVNTKGWIINWMFHLVIWILTHVTIFSFLILHDYYTALIAYSFAMVSLVVGWLVFHMKKPEGD